MNLKYERDFTSASTPGFRFQVRRISLAQRIHFLADNHDLMQRVKFLTAGIKSDVEERNDLVGLELELSRRLLQQCLCAVNTGDAFEPVDSNRIDWLLNQAPTELCIEVLTRVSEEISLSEQRRKN